MDLKAQLEHIYRAGFDTFPEYAGQLAATANVLATSTAAWEGQSWSAGDPRSLTLAVKVNQEAHELLWRAIATWNDAATALVAIADDYVSTDDGVAGWADQLRTRLKQDPADAPTHQPHVPPAYGAEA